MIDYISCQVTGIGNGAGQHRCCGIFIGANDSRYLQRNAIVIKILQSGIGLPQIGIKTGLLIQAETVRIQNGMKFHLRNGIVIPLLMIVFQFGLIQSSSHNRIYFFLWLQAKRIQRHIVQFVVLIQYQNNFIIRTGPSAIYNIILLLHQFIDTCSAIIRKQFLP